MKKPVYGDELTIRYQGAMLKATCNEVTEMPRRGPGAAKITIVSKTIFHNGGEAFLLSAGEEASMRVERVTTMPHKRINIVSFFGLFDAPVIVSEVAAITPANL
jgi:hypothetical protein